MTLHSQMTGGTRWKKKAVFGQCGDLLNIHPCHCIEYLQLILPKLLLKHSFKQFSLPFSFSKSYQISLLWHSCEGDISLLPCWLFKEGVNKVMTLEKVDNRFWWQYYLLYNNKNDENIFFHSLDFPAWKERETW